MVYRNYLILILVSTIKCSFSIKTINQNNTIDMLRNPRNFSTRERQNLQYNPYPHPNIIPDLQKQYQQPYFYNHLKSNPYERPHPNLYYSDPYYQQSAEQSIRQNVMDLLYSIARNDNLQCVPKILCEITAGTMYGRQNGVNLPVNMNLESLVGFLSFFNDLQSLPLLYFGKAAALGYSSKDNKRSCAYFYPECPSDPDKLIQYLNNHNGGFFRYFSGIHPQSYIPGYGNFYPNNLRPSNFKLPYYEQKNVIEKRIQNMPVAYISSNAIRQNKKILFPGEELLQFYIRPSSTISNYFKFPESASDSFRRPKTFIHNQNINFEKPLPNHKASPFIFPDRTGTGELIVDSNDFDKNTEYESTKYNDISSNINNYNRFRGGRELFFPDR